MRESDVEVLMEAFVRLARADDRLRIRLLEALADGDTVVLNAVIRDGVLDLSGATRAVVGNFNFTEQ